MARRAAGVRLFVAVDPPAHVCERLSGWARLAARAEGVFPRRDAMPRLLAPESMHLTICFLGQRPAAEVEPLASALAGCARDLPELSLGAPLWLPPRRPRALAVEVRDDTGALRQLRDAVVAAIADVCDTGPTRPAGEAPRRFTPHITVARLRSHGRPLGRPLAPTPALRFLARQLVLYRSLLGSDGASYEALSRVPLAAS